MPYSAPDVPMITLSRSEEHTSELQSQSNLVCRLLLEKKKQPISPRIMYPPARHKRLPHVASPATHVPPIRSHTRPNKLTYTRRRTLVRLSTIGRRDSC